MEKKIKIIAIIFLHIRGNRDYFCLSSKAGVAELVDALDLGSSEVTRAGSIPVTSIFSVLIRS